MYWEEAKTDSENIVPDDIVDLVYGISCRCLPVDHSYELSQAIIGELPWITDEQDVGIHAIHVAESANGWIRPEGPDAILHPSRRTKMTLRIPKHRVKDAEKLIGRELQVGDYPLTIKQFVERPLSPLTTIFSRYIVSGLQNTDTEEQFMENIVALMKALNVRPKKMLCGIEHLINTPEGRVSTRSLMVAELDFNETIILQQKGLGSHRKIGCGIFIPHKDIAEISEDLG